MANKSGCGPILAALAFSLAAFIAYAGYANHRGESGANNLCDSMRAGEAVVSARAKMVASGGNLKLLDYDADVMSVYFQGAFVERYSCNVWHANGKVTRTDVHHLD